jgi:hypothetical protein
MIPTVTRAHILPYEKWPRAKSPPLNVQSYSRRGSLSVEQLIPRICVRLAPPPYVFQHLSTLLFFSRRLNLPSALL